MRKMAIFVEGRTELEFDSKLIEEIASTKAVTIESRKIRGGSRVPRTCQRIAVKQAGQIGQTSTHYFMLYDCGNDELPKSRMIEEYPSLSSSGYTKIICHRDVAPDYLHSEIPRLEQGLPYGVRTVPIRVTFILSVMEIEAWFLAEHRHFEKIDPSLSVSTISAALGFDPSNDDMQLRTSPAQDLHNCYSLVGKCYSKYNSQSTIDAIDTAAVYVEVATKFSYLSKLCQEIIDFLET